MARPRAQAAGFGEPHEPAEIAEEPEEPKNPFAPATSVGPDEELPGIDEHVAGPNPDELETDKLGVPAGHVSVYNGPVSQPVIPGDPVIRQPTEPLDVEQPEQAGVELVEGQT